MSIEGNAGKLRIYTGETDEVNGRPLYEEIVRAARNSGLAGSSVFSGGFFLSQPFLPNYQGLCPFK